MMFQNAKEVRIPTAENVFIHAKIKGSGEPLLLLHGHPETCLMWHKTEEELSKRYTIVAADLRGYGDSSHPADIPGHSNYSKRVMGEDMAALMSTLGFQHFSIMGHDRGARVGYRMALDHPEMIDKLVLLDIVSTYDMYSQSSWEFYKALFQWFFFTQSAPLPEHMIESSREEFFRTSLHIGRYHSRHDTPPEVFPEEVFRDYYRCYTSETIHSICEEYRAGESIDRVLDEEDLKAGRKIRAKTLALWGADGLVERFFEPIKCWEKFCPDITGHSLPCGHFIPEEAPEELLEALKQWDGFL